jgi:hypothetical protein
MGTLLNKGKRFVGWGVALIATGALCMFFEFIGVGTSLAFVGLVCLAAGGLGVLSGSIIFCAVASPRKAVLFGGGTAVIAVIAITMTFFIDSNVHGPTAPVVLALAGCSAIGILVFFIGLIRLTLDQKARRVA